MFREIIQLGPIHIYTYGFMQFLAFIAGIFLSVKRAKKYEIDKNVIFDLAFWILIGGIAGGRIWYIIEHFSFYQNNLASIFYVWEGGLVISCGLLLGFITGFVYIKKNKLSFLELADIVSPAILLGIAIGRIGCFLNGCCYGMESDKLGIIFHDRSYCQLPTEVPSGIKVIPTQIYSSVSAFFFTVFLLLLDKRKKYYGETFSWLLVFYGVHRFSIDFLRFYEGKATLLKFITLSQALSIILILTGIILIVRFSFYRKKPNS